MATESAQEIERRLKKVLLDSVARHLDPATITTETPLVTKGLALDSVALLEFVVGIEAEFGVILDDAALNVEHFRSLGALADYLRDLVASGPP